MAMLCRTQFGWDRVGLLYTTDAYGVGGSSKFIEAADTYNLTVIADISFPLLATRDDLDLPIRRLKDTRGSLLSILPPLRALLPSTKGRD